MNVHLVRSKEVSEELYWDVVSLLEQFKGPVTYKSSDSFSEYTIELLNKEIIEDLDVFVTSQEFFSHRESSDVFVMFPF